MNVHHGVETYLAEHSPRAEWCSLQVLAADRETATTTRAAPERHITRHNLFQGKVMAFGVRAPGQHLKRGLPLYGPPGTGKTHTIRYLLGDWSPRR